MKNKWNTFLTTHKAGFRLLRIVKLIDRNLLPLSIMEACLNAILPYISLVFCAKIIDALLQQSYQSAGYYVAIMLATILGIGFISAWILYKTRISQRLLQTNLEILIRKKGMELEYDTICNPEIQKALRNAEDAAKYNGGLGNIVGTYKELLQNTLGALTAVVFSISFCLTVGDSGNEVLNFLALPIVTFACLIGVWVLGMKLAKRQSEIIKQMEDHIADQHYVVENQISYWLFEVLYNVESGKTIRVNGMQDLIHTNINKFIKQSIPLYESMGIGERKRVLSQGIESGLFSIVAYIFVLIKVVTKAISIGSFTKYAGAFLQFHQASTKIIWSVNEVNRLTKNLLPLADYLDRTNQRFTGTIPIEKRNDHVFEIEFHDVGFSYPNSDEYSLRHVNAKITLKNKLAVVGRNGAGKTTFIKLLCRLYDPTEGQITLNGIDIKKYNYDEYLTLFGVVFQDFYLFASSIGENIAVSREYDKKRVEDCLDKSGILSFVSKLEQRDDTVIENGTENAIDISGGQEQKISIARALYKDAPFVILDEPTAALDPISEAEIYERFHEMVEDKTSVYISHRMSSCRFCDEILVFDEGTITERGSHEELLQRNGTYSSLWNAQAQYYA
jgi:ATP-binding cassette subfamily B protein